MNAAVATMRGSITTDAISASIGKRDRQRFLAGTGLFGFGIVAVTLALALGAVQVPATDVWKILLGTDAAGVDPIHANVVWGLRLPRLLAGFLIGASLAISGAALQGLMRNPLADPGLIGVSAGAALGAIVVIIFAAPFLADLPSSWARYALPVAAFLGGLVVTWMIYSLADRGGHTDIAMLLLAGIAVNSVVGAVIGVGIFVSDDQQLRDFQFWTLGSLGGISWQGVFLPFLMMIISMIVLWRLSGVLNGLALGEADAHHMGFAVEACKRTIVVFVAMAVGAGVAIAGTIGFVGLIVPHLVRLMVGIDHRYLMPLSALLGGSMLVAADTIARLVVLPAELPIGIITSAVGGPFFLLLLLRHRRELSF